MRFVQSWRERIDAAADDGPVYLWGAGAKGVTFAQLVDPDGIRLAGVVDVNPKKQNRYMALTGLAVLAPDKLPDRAGTVIVMNPNYLKEIAAWLGDHRSRFISISVA